MRPIKFRAWDIFNADMFATNDAPGSFERFFRDIDKRRDGGNIIYLMQFTGLKDQCGKDIYEDDRVKFLGFIGDVKFANGQWQFDLEDRGTTPVYNYDQKDMLIIGNLHQNPELLRA